MSPRPPITARGVGYALPRGEIERGAIGALHAIDPGTGRGYCGTPLSITWSAEDAGSAEADCPDCRHVIDQGRTW